MIVDRNQFKNPVYVGDTMGDFEAAKKNEIPFIYAEYGFGKVDSALYSINHFQQIQDTLETIYV